MSLQELSHEYQFKVVVRKDLSVFYDRDFYEPKVFFCPSSYDIINNDRMPKNYKEITKQLGLAGF